MSRQPLLTHLPLQLTIAMSEWLSSTTACAALSGVSPHSKKRLLQAVDAEGRKRLIRALEGIRRYRNTAYARELKEPPVIARYGAARLLDYSALAQANARPLPPLLLVPSLINRYTILDLSARRSFARHLAAQGIPTLLLDWGEPGERELGYDCGDYVTATLLPALRFVREASGAKPVLAGYCMGGILSLAAAVAEPGGVAGLALLATPWDFHAEGVQRIRLDAAMRARIEALLEAERSIRPEWVQALFLLQNPSAFAEKFRRFAALKDKSPCIQEFMALEEWVNDGVAMSRNVAKECLLGWVQENRLARGEWRVAGLPVRPDTLKRMPVFAAVPRHDRIVPESSALPLAESLPCSTLVQPVSGHVGMIVGSRARKELWEPFVAWYSVIPAQAGI